jgi:hypothetical protein
MNNEEIPRIEEEKNQSIGEFSGSTFKKNGSNDANKKTFFSNLHNSCDVPRDSSSKSSGGVKNHRKTFTFLENPSFVLNSKIVEATKSFRIRLPKMLSSIDNGDSA